MAKDFNVYQWRRNHLNEGNQNLSLKAAMEEWFGSSTPTKEEMMGFIEWFYNQGAGEPSMIGLNEDLKINDEISREKVAEKFDKIFFGGKKILNKEDILKLPFKKLRFNGMYSINPQSEKLPNFISPKGPEQKFTMSDNPEDIYGAVGTVD